MRALRSFAVIAAALLALAACGDSQQDTAETPIPPAPDGAMPEAVDEDAEALFAAACEEQGAEAAVCACMRERVVTAGGMRGLGYVGAAFGADPLSAAPYEAAMTQDARDIAAEAYLDAQYECIAGDDPALIPPVPPPGDAAAPAESPLEQAVMACVEYGVADEPLCRCRAEAAFEALGEEGLALVEADARGDQAMVEALAGTHGAQWLNDGLGAMAGARAQCGL